MEINSPTEQQDSIKLIKNTKGHNWELKFYSKEHDELVKEIERVNKILEEKYGN